MGEEENGEEEAQRRGQMDDTKAGLDQTEAEEKYIKKQVKKKNRNVITALPARPSSGPPNPFVQPQSRCLQPSLAPGRAAEGRRESPAN